VWNYSLVRSTQPAQVDVYLIFLGAFSLLSIFTLIFVELLCANALTTRVWFECAWVALFWIMQLAGGAALIAIESDLACSFGTTTFRNTLCTSEYLLLAFTWMCTVMLLVYLVALMLLTVSQHHGEPKIWVSDVRGLRATAKRQCSPITPNSPWTNRCKKRPSVDIYTPYPRRSSPVQPFPFPYRTGLSDDYEIEPFRPVFVATEQMDIPHSSDLPEATPLPPPAAAPIMPSFSKPMPALPRDAENVRSRSLIQVDRPQGLVSSIEYTRSGRPAGPVSGQSRSLPSPSPLGNWPRQDVMQLPAKPKRKPLPPSALEFSDRHTGTMARAPVPPDTVTQPRSRRPSGPRLRELSGDSVHRPAPLDLSGISNHETGRRDAGWNV
jgi:hypothetical protein